MILDSIHEFKYYTHNFIKNNFPIMNDQQTVAVMTHKHIHLNELGNKHIYDDTIFT